MRIKPKINVVQDVKKLCEIGPGVMVKRNREKRRKHGGVS